MKQPSFLENRSGNVAMMMGLALIPLITLIGFATDASRQQSAEGELQAAIDMAALATVRTFSDATMTEDQRRAYAANYISENYSQPAFVSLAQPQILFPKNGRVEIIQTGALPSAFLGVIGKQELGLNVSSAAEASGAAFWKRRWCWTSHAQWRASRLPI